VEQGFGLASEAGCSTPFSFFKQDLAKRFLDFANVPDELVPGINYDEMACPKGKKASKKCKEKNGDRDNNDSPSKTGSNNNDKQPSQTAKNQAIVTTMILHRRLEATTMTSSHPRPRTISPRRRTSLIALRLAAMI